MQVNQVAKAVLKYYSNFPHSMREDILHTQEVVCYTRMIASGENLSQQDTDMQEIAAWLHDIGCPHSKEIHGNSLPQNQQSVGREVAQELLQEFTEITPREKQWLIEVVATHHQFEDSLRLGFTPLFEADLIVNLLSGYYKKEQAENLYNKIMVSKTGKALFLEVVCGALDIKF
ncbi:MAG: HD domain-containing protein [Rikenellaceae bacterium]